MTKIPSDSISEKGKNPNEEMRRKTNLYVESEQ
jgi:hypothetical protein